MTTKAERVAEFLKRLSAAPAAGTHDEAFELVTKMLNSVEDDMTEIPYDPDNYLSDGRLYPPKPDSRRTVPGRDDVMRYRSRGHNTWIAANGAVLITRLPGNIVLLSKPGADGALLEV